VALYLTLVTDLMFYQPSWLFHAMM